MERQPYGTNGVSKFRSFPYKSTKKLGRSYKVYGNSTRNNFLVMYGLGEFGAVV